MSHQKKQITILQIIKMKNFSERLNFSTNEKELENSVKINRNNDVNYYDTLCLYCANNSINLENVSDDDFDAAVEILKNFGSNDASLRYEFNNIFFFSI